jgi:hypothetical protein
MKTPTDMLASDLRRMAGAIPVGWRAAVLMAIFIIVFPIVVVVFVLDALTHDMPTVRHPFNKLAEWWTAVVHRSAHRAARLQARPQVRHAH